MSLETWCDDLLRIIAMHEEVEKRIENILHILDEADNMICVNNQEELPNE